MTTFARILVSALALVLFSSAACTQPIVLETGAAACGDAVDNDGDGRTDCADEDCAASGVCEVTADACRDGIDQDHDGAVDCADQDCVRAGLCEPFASDCLAAGRGICPEAMSCYPAGPGGALRQCARPGSVGDWLACATPADCAGARSCVDGICAPICRATVDCPSGALCVPRAGMYASCAPPCVPGAVDEPCAAAGGCQTLTELAFTYDPALPLAACVLARGPAGGAQRGEPCGASEARAQRCAAGLVCHPEEPSPRCRAICATELRDRTAPIVPCADALTCVLQNMDVSAPANGLLTRVTGLCLPPGVAQ